MNLLFLILIVAASFSASASKLTEAEIMQITKESQDYILGQSHMGLCGDAAIAEGRVILSETYILNDSDVPSASVFGGMYFRCPGSVVWEKGEYCEFRKALHETNWEIDYCDT